MKVHIVGAGPTGMSLAWELLKSGEHQVTIYDRKMSAGGSWWEPSEEVRDLHAHRIVFDRAYINTQSLFKRWVSRGIPYFNRQMETMYGSPYVLSVSKIMELSLLISKYSHIYKIQVHFIEGGCGNLE